ncbi:hypothetical protein AVEN_83959-1 [Araneus ventricosus]|uniref:Uncharacterized protein n=1 Tax=Araneus ventricosus TaxID=182803 RepID=A0A4Y2BSM7_ARAVE|nr:hypothetical protein AVEN_83959-1 [Araneus ventricosus]
MDSSTPFPLSSSLRVAEVVNVRTFHLLSLPEGVPKMTTCPTAFPPHSELQPAEMRPTSVEVAWPLTAGLGVRELKYRTLVGRGSLRGNWYGIRDPQAPRVRLISGLDGSVEL